MSSLPFSREHLEAYLDEALPVDQMACVEQTLREDPRVLQELAAIVASRDRGVHTLGAIWRRNRVSCPSREQLHQYVHNQLSRQWARYVRFHLQVIGCRFCLANVEDLQQGTQPQSPQRRRRYLRSSAGYLPKSAGS